MLVRFVGELLCGVVCFVSVLCVSVCLCALRMMSCGMLYSLFFVLLCVLMICLCGLIVIDCVMMYGLCGLLCLCVFFSMFTS